MSEDPTRDEDRARSEPDEPNEPAERSERDGLDGPDRDRLRGEKTGTSLPTLGVRGTLLFLLLLLAIASVPGSLLPQRNVNPENTQQYLNEHGSFADLLDTLGFFDVFSSPWFSAIYLLLFVSLVGCVVPRLGVHWRQLRSRPPRTPGRLTRFAGYTRVEMRGTAGEDAPASPSADADTAVAQLADSARTRLRRSRYRTDVIEEKGGAISVTAERGYLRETGNLLFHIALLGVLIGVAAGGLTQYRGQITVVEGEGFTNSLTQYDTFEAGAWADSDDLTPFRFTLDEFRAEYDTSSDTHRFGQPTLFEADLSVSEPGKGDFQQTLRLNQPLHVAGSSMHLLGNGYAPEITVTDPEGNVVAEGPIISVPSGDTGYTSQLVIKAPDAQPDQMAVVGFFLSGPHSEFPGLVDPQLAVTVYTGDLGLDTGVPTNAYQIDVENLTPVTDEDGKQSLLRLYPGQEAELPDGSTISFDGIRRYAAFDIKHDPFQVFTLVILEVAGLARSDDERLEEDVHDLADTLAGPQANSPGGSPS
jgi:cytochrome c biogenesis protein